jgi:hypothetical protein
MLIKHPAVYMTYCIHPSVLNGCDDTDLYDCAKEALDSTGADLSSHGLTREEAATVTFWKSDCAQSG